MKKLITMLICVVIIASFATSAIELTKAIATADETVWIATSGKGKRYHYESCRTLRGGKKEISLSQAQKMGYTSCGVCNR